VRHSPGKIRGQDGRDIAIALSFAAGRERLLIARSTAAITAEGA
jgi:hypothetical protein